MADEALWQQCLADWLSQIERKSGRDNTRRAYEADVTAFLSYSGKQLGEITSAHAERWAQHLHSQGQAMATINRRISALSSLYRYADGFPGIGPIASNPFGARSLRSRNAAAPVAFPTPEQVDDLLAAIPTGTATGLRNLAIIAGLVATTRRINEWIGLRGGDVEHVARLHWFSYRCKGGDKREQELPDAIWRIIEAYLRRANRWPLAAEAYVFVALSDNGDRLHRRQVADGPLNAGYVARLIQRYGRAAGIPEACLYPHALRHAGAEMRRELGADVIDLQRVLGHKSPATTMGYLRRLDRPRDPQAELIGERLTRRFKIEQAR